jgi:hypothetical protein
LLGVFVGVTSVAVLAQRGAVAVQDAVTADPRHYSVSFENELVRLLRVRYGAEEKSVMHRHPASCTVFLTDQTFNLTLPEECSVWFAQGFRVWPEAARPVDAKNAPTGLCKTAEVSHSSHTPHRHISFRSTKNT